VHGALALEPRKDKSCSTNGTRSTVGSTTGGVMTKEVGAVTGELEVTTRHRVEGTEVAVRYFGAEERYTVAPVICPLAYRACGTAMVGESRGPAFWQNKCIRGCAEFRSA
jgi:hypothetical protein